MTGAKKQIAHHGESKVWWIEHWTKSPKDLATVPGSVADSFCDLEEVIQLLCVFGFFLLPSSLFPLLSVLPSISPMDSVSLENLD